MKQFHQNCCDDLRSVFDHRGIFGSIGEGIGLNCAIEGADHALAAAIENMGVDHGGFDIFVSEEFLDSTDVVAILE